MVDQDFKDRNKAGGEADGDVNVVNGHGGDGGDENVDEHHQHATILRQLLELKSSVMVRAHETEKPLRYFYTSVGSVKWEVVSIKGSLQAALLHKLECMGNLV